MNKAYVLQDNVHIACFTVRETLEFAANLRMHERYSILERSHRVEAENWAISIAELDEASKTGVDQETVDEA